MESTAPYPAVEKISRQARKVAYLGILLTAVLSWRNTDQFFQSYLIAFIFWFGIAVGCLGIWLLFHITGGKWGKPITPILESSAMTLPWLGLAFLPLVWWGLHHLYSWSLPGYMMQTPELQHKAGYLNPHFFKFRALIYFIIWIILAMRLRSLTAKRRAHDSPELKFTSHKVGALGMVLFVVSVSFAAFDWLMSLDPTWASSIYGAMVLISFVLAAFAFSIVVLGRVAASADGFLGVTEEAALDLGNLLLAFVMLWAYMQLSQFLIIWYGNLPEEISWYLARRSGGWDIATGVLVLCQFAIPFLLLLARQNKRRLQRLAGISLGILWVHLLNELWLIVPEFYPAHFHIHLLDLVLPIAFGGVWLIIFAAYLKWEPLPGGPHA